jgi:DNA-binding response OmpR family regulator
MNQEILIIDDDKAILEVMKLILQEKGYSVITISDSYLAEDYIHQHLPQMIFVDFWMAGLNGKKIVTQLKSNDDSKAIPVIMISANHEVKKIANEINADDFLAKPFDIIDLTKIVEKYTSKNTI